ncbi:PREDICTED: uncharacterized protein LOC106124453 [Papilio xuthus]|uniref:Uncharacterized protein LOC106124453 n=1 Tax=Papilio xuthus TaxID=66420 RepID=A0AAJ6ZPD6_PAPXU|nr:PREDICTED: uncharacterized protein LOC106124453 [Papilio xuthus]
MTKSSTTVVQSHIGTINFPNPVNNIEAHFLYPKLAIIEDRRKVTIIDIECEFNNETRKSFVFDLEEDITDNILLEHLLWLTLKSYVLVVINIKTGTLVNIRCNNYANYKICQFYKHNNNLVLMSESGECLALPFSATQLDSYIKQSDNEMIVTLEKLHISRSVLKSQETLTLLNELNAYIESGKVILQCSSTGVIDVLSTDALLEYIVPWTNSLIMANQSNMWMIDLRDFSTTYQFSNETSKYYPLKAVNKTFYYILWDKEQVQVKSASICHNENDESESSNNKVTSKTTQDNLKVQLNTIVSSAISNVKPAQVLPQLQSLFNNITDFNFLINAAIKLCKQNISYKVIVYPLQTKIISKNDNVLINLITDLTNKIDLLEYILFRGNNFYEDVDLFELNFIQLCILFISKSDLDLASICWLKYSEMRLQIQHSDIVNFLKAIPYNIKIGALIIWLNNFVPSILEENPFYVDLFVKWTTERIFYLEKSPYWPKIGVKFIQEIINVLETSIKTISIRPMSLDDLDILKDRINYIMELKEKYKINMLLSELSSQNPTEVAVIVLRRCYTEDLEEFLQNNLPSYATRHLFDLDDLLYSFIESEAAASGGSVDGVRLQLLLNAFRSNSNKLKCLLQVLKVLDVPWNSKILELAITAAASANTDFTVTDEDRILAQDIHIELNYAKVKVVLKKYNFPLTCTDYNLVMHKIIDAPSIDLCDLKVITTVLPLYTNTSHILYIDKCLQNCETKLALNYFEQLPNKDKKMLLKTVMNKYELINIGIDFNATLERNYLDFLKGTKSVNKIQMRTLENMYHLKNSYGIKLSIDAMYTESCCTREVDIWIQNDGASASSGRGRCLSKLVNKDLCRNSALVALLRRTSTSQEVCKVIEFMITSDPCSQKMTQILQAFKDGNNSKLLIECNNVLTQLVLNCDEEDIHILITRMSILNSLINTNVVLKNLSVAWKFHYIFLPISSVNALNDLIDFYGKVSTNELNIEREILNISNKNDLIPFRVISYLMVTVFEMDRSSCDDLLKVRDGLARKLLSKIISLQDIDNALLTILLIILTRFEDENDNTWVLEILRAQSETLAPSIMHYLSVPVTRSIFGLSTILPGNLITYPPQYVLKSKFNIELSEIALPDGTEETWDVKVVLFHVLRQYPNTTLERLYDLCRTFNVSLDDGLSLLLISVLINWNLKYKLIEDDLGCRKLKLDNDERELVTRCHIIWDSIEKINFIQDILNDFWKSGEIILHGSVISINPYYYEVYFCIYLLLFGSSTELRNNKEYFLLHFLKYYKRKGTPKQYEYEMFSVKGMFPEIGYYRLPFHLFMREDMWTHLKSEITLETYERWLQIVSILSLNKDLQTAKDMICSNAVKQTMTSRTKSEEATPSSKENEPWRLTSREEPLLRTAHKCVRHIANMEWAGACLFYVLQGCARGADQVAAAHLCFQFSQRWATLQPGNRALRQMERLYATLSTRHALHNIDWACEEFIRLSTEPAQLIHAMYLHPDFVDKIARYDVNRAANEIADKNNINISTIRIQILENLLQKSEKETETSPGLNTKELITAKYILRATCSKMAAIYLSRIALDEECEFNKCKKLRAFQCLMSVVDPDTAVKVTNRERDSLWSLLLELLYVVNLEKIDMPWVVATFVQDKVHALQQLLQVANGNIEGLKIAAALALRYGDAHIIRELIPLLVRASLHDEVIPLLLKYCHILDEVVYTAWRAVMLTPFQRADYPITERQKKKCLKVLNLLPVCPLIKDEDLLEIWKHCVRCKCLGLGCLVLPYITPQTRQKLTELQKIDRRNLIISIKNLHAESYLVPGAMIALENLGSKTHR